MDKYIFGIILKSSNRAVFEPINSGTMAEVVHWMQTVMNMSAVYKKLESNAGYFMMPESEFHKLHELAA